MDEKKCPYCWGIVKDDYCSHCGAYVPPEKQVDSDQAPELPPVHEPSHSRWDYSEEVPWERMEELGFWSALGETIKEILGTPEDFFSRLSPTGGFGKPLLYGLILGVVGVILGQIWTLVGNAIGFSAAGMMGSEFSNVMQQQATGIVSIIMLILVSVVAVPIGLFINAGVLHLMLMILGGANEDFEATFRAIAYSQTAQLAQIIPIIGTLAAAIWTIVLEVKALANLHDITSGKALLAIFLPLIVCCFVLGFFVCAIGGIGSLAAGAR